MRTIGPLSLCEASLEPEFSGSQAVEPNRDYEVIHKVKPQACQVRDGIGSFLPPR